MNTPPKQSRGSFAHERADLREANPLYERAGSARADFDASNDADDPARAARRASFMVMRQRAQPVLRPSPALALGADSVAFDAQWNAERHDARAFQDSLNQQKGIRSMDDEFDQREDDFHAKPSTDRNPPRDVLRDGNLKASIWRNDGDNGPYYATSLSRSYKDRNGELRDTHSFAGPDLLRVSELARKAYERTQELRRDDRQQARPDRQDAARPRDQREPSPTAPVQEREARREAFMEQRQQPRAASARRRDQSR